MRLIRNRPGNLVAGSFASRSSIVAVGNFDGMHRGHLALIERCREKASIEDAIAVVTFEPLPQAFFRPEQAPGRLLTVHQKLSCFQTAGVDLVWMMRFGKDLAACQRGILQSKC
jgi:riboflavin kinase/FMN adenylyltransferase